MSIISAFQLVIGRQNMADKKETEKIVIGVPVSDTDAMRALTAQSIGGVLSAPGTCDRYDFKAVLRHCEQ